MFANPVVMDYASIQPAGGDTARPLNLEKRLAVINRFCDLAGARVVDCGCGAGEYMVALEQHGAEAWGLEYSRAKADLYRRHHPRRSRYCVGDLAHIGFQDEMFDVALLNEVLEHVPDDFAALQEVHRILKTGGRLVVFSPNRRYPFESHGVTLRGSSRRVPHYVPFVPYVPVGIGRRVLDYWARNYWPRQLRQLVTRAGFAVEATDYVWQTFEGISSHQPAIVAALAPVLRRAANAFECTPMLRGLGISQIVVARKTAAATGRGSGGTRR
jgi:ubiquinone/menaquinone biosynthesis C-methylase UbiE